MREVAKIRTDFLFPVNDILMNLPNLKELFIPLNKHGSNAENVKIFNDSLESDNLILFFPAGLVSRKSKNGIVDLEWKKTFITKAVKFQRDIVPVHISGQNTGFFYNLANLRKKLNIKSNIEMLFLVDEMYKQKEKKITITFGKPIPVGVFDKRFAQSEWAEIVKNFVYQIGTGQKMVDENFDYLI
jgi:putative hemolysin